ncbi:MAG: nucleotide sugar dehydrogenase [Thermoplasmata archaeon]|nr:nucleotide sugar dehydrogenase [Thermoplasmata archaeon]
MATGTVSIIGLGKLGVSMAAAIANRGFTVIGVDVSKTTVDNINAGKAPVQETNLQEYIDKNKDRLSATLSHRDAILNSDISFVIVPTPSDQNGAFSIKYAASAFRAIGLALKEKKGYHLVVLTSTVLPGSTRYGLLPIIEHESGKKCGPDFGLCYSPEFIALGSVIYDFLNPDFLLVGEFDKQSGDTLERYYKQIMVNNPPCRRMSIENAELAKISLNSYITMKITFANILTELCEKIPGGDVDAISDALGLDKRIGRKYLTGGLGFGGPCFPRDNIALNYFSGLLGVRNEIAEATDRFNRTIPDRFIDRLKHLIKPGSTVAVLGLSYKPFSCVVEESQGVLMARSLSKQNLIVKGFDPLASKEAKRELGDDIEMKGSLKECLAEADVVLITTQDPLFSNLTLKDFQNGKKEVIVVDFWRMLRDKLSGQPGIQYIPVGHGENNRKNIDGLEKMWKDAQLL